MTNSVTASYESNRSNSMTNTKQSTNVK